MYGARLAGHGDGEPTQAGPKRCRPSDSSVGVLARKCNQFVVPDQHVSLASRQLRAAVCFRAYSAVPRHVARRPLVAKDADVRCLNLLGWARQNIHELQEIAGFPPTRRSVNSVSAERRGCSQDPHVRELSHEGMAGTHHVKAVCQALQMCRRPLRSPSLYLRRGRVAATPSAALPSLTRSLFLTLTNLIWPLKWSRCELTEGSKSPTEPRCTKTVEGRRLVLGCEVRCHWTTDAVDLTKQLAALKHDRRSQC